MNKRQWKEYAHSYMRRYLHQMAHIETLCSGEEEGPIAREAARFDNQGLKGVNLNHILKGMKGIAKSKAALEYWSPAEKQTWTRHQERLAQMIETKPYKSNPLPAAENPAPAQEHRNMLRTTHTPTSPTRKENHSETMPTKPKPPTLAPDSASLKTTPGLSPERQIAQTGFWRTLYNNFSKVIQTTLKKGL